MPDPGTMPGEDIGPDPDSIAQVNAAINQGYNYNDISSYNESQGMDAPPRPSLDAIVSGTHEDASQWTQGGQNELALDTPEAAQTQIDQLANSGLGVGTVEGAVGNTVRSLVQTTAEELTPYMSEADMAVQEVGGLVRDALTAPGVKTGAALGAGYATFVPASSGE